MAPIPFRDVRLADGFWKTWQETNQKRTIPYVFKRLEQAGHVENFTKAAGRSAGTVVGEVYFDSDVYKTIEGAACSLANQSDPPLAAYLDQLISTVAAAQRENGYLHTYTTLRHPREPWKSPGRHELYCAGHLLEAGVGRYEATGNDDLLKVARKLADHLAATFGPAPQQVHFPPEHQGVELGLLRLSDVTRDRRYADLARFFLDQRGRAGGRQSHGVYGQDHCPVVEQTEAVGHAVRAAYMYAAMAQLAGRAKHADYTAPLQQIFDDLTRGKMFVSGGVGLLQHGNVHESFTEAWFLPNDQPDVDTCSVIGLVYWLHRMHLLQPDGRYGDLIERILYNRLLAGMSLDGTRFFYGCPLASRGPGTFDAGPGAECDAAHTRPKWFRCVCCPTNLPRILATIGGYAYARGSDGLYVDQYFPGHAKARVGDSQVEIAVATGYPWNGSMRITLRPPRPEEFGLHLRIPGWAAGEEFPGGMYRSTGALGNVSLKINDREVALPEIQRGYARLARRWEPGDIVDLQLPMNVRRVKADPRLKAAVGRVALMRGPILYCVEGTDHAGRVQDLLLRADADLQAEPRPDLLGGVTVLRGTALSKARDGDAKTGTKAEYAPVKLLAVPFYAWDNREPGEMVVWLPEVASQ